MIKNKRVLITGGAGFIGTEITRRLAEDNQITIYDSFSRNADDSCNTRTAFLQHADKHS